MIKPWNTAAGSVPVLHFKPRIRCGCASIKLQVRKMQYYLQRLYDHQDRYEIVKEQRSREITLCKKESMKLALSGKI